MPLNFDRLISAAERYAAHAQAKKSVDGKAVAKEIAAVARRHVEMFLPQMGKLAATLRSGAVGQTAIGTAAGDSHWVDGGLVPEIISRDNDLRPVSFLELALLVARSVGRIRVSDGRLSDEGDATGFMVAPGLLMTNHHVLPNEAVAAASMIVFDDEVTIQGEPKQTQTFRLRPDLLYLGDEELDFALVQVSATSSSGVALGRYGHLRLFKQTGKLDPTQRQAANIIQHPGGGFKKLAIRDNYFEPAVPAGVDPAKELNSIFYGTDTLKGSSGAPVCSDQWYVVALHRGGVPYTEERDGRRVVIRKDGSPAQRGDSAALIQFVANEGTRVSRIYERLDEIAGRDDARAASAKAALQRLMAVSGDPHAGPVDIQTSPLLPPPVPNDEMGGPEEIVRRAAEKFAGAAGYSPTFLGRGRRVMLPKESVEVKRDLAKLKDSEETELKYDHFSVKMNASRRTAFYVAGNVDGAQFWNVQTMGRKPDRPRWSIDPRMDESLQPDDAIFSTAMQRGHLYKREDVWGSDRESSIRADEHSFTITNATPMIANFNNLEWGDLEDVVTKECKKGNKVSYFAGPIFRPDDPFFNELRAGVPIAERRRGMRVPQLFWKIVAWVEDAALKSAGFILSQKEEIDEHGPITEEINFGVYRKVSIADIETATGLHFPELAAVDTFENEQGGNQ